MGKIYADVEGNLYEEVDENDVLDMSEPDMTDDVDELSGFIGNVDYMLETGGYDEWLKRIFDLSEYAVMLEDEMVAMMGEHPELDHARYEVVIRRI